jgi:hypothetical protein
VIRITIEILDGGTSDDVRLSTSSGSGGTIGGPGDAPLGEATLASSALPAVDAGPAPSTPAGPGDPTSAAPASMPGDAVAAPDLPAGSAPGTPDAVSVLDEGPEG